MNVRELVCLNEKNFLCEQAVKSDESRGRMYSREPDPIRTDFQRDRDKILHSKAFRRLMHKTQVFLSPDDDHYRTRLTHTLEVSQIARTIARGLRLNEDLTEAIALGHDLGHTPFGHAGERLLRRVMDPKYHHSKQSLRVADVIEKLNLTEEVRDGILNHSADSAAFTLEGMLVRQADRIAFISHDIEDACRARVLSQDDIPLLIRNVLGYTHGERIDCMVNSVIRRGIADGNVFPEPEVLDAIEDLHAFLFDAVYTNPVAKSEEVRAESMLGELYEYFIAHPDEMPELYRNVEATGNEQRVADYIAGMTDRYAISLFKKLFIPQVWQGIKSSE